MTAVGRAFTVTAWLAVLLQPLALVTVKEYVPAELTVIAAFVDPVDHRYPVPPDPVKVTEPPTQKIVGPEGEIAVVGRAFTVTD